MSNPELVQNTLLNLLFVVENAVKEHYFFLQRTLSFECTVIDRMWVLAQRYIMIIKGVPTKRTYPVDICPQIEDEIRTEFHMKLGIVDEMNLKLSASLSNVRNTFFELGQYLTTMDSDCLHFLEKRDISQPPLTYYIELFGDFLKFFTKSQSKLNCFALLLSADNVQSLEKYKKLLEPNKEFNDYFLQSVAFCSCLHTQKQEKT